jgi:hypothetical protein
MEISMTHASLAPRIRRKISRTSRVGGLSPEVRAPGRPKIVVICMDDMGY